MTVRRPLDALEGVTPWLWSARPGVGERLDDLARRMDAGFARVDADIREVRADIGGLRLTLLRMGGGIMIGLVGVSAAILVSPLGG